MEIWVLQSQPEVLGKLTLKINLPLPLPPAPASPYIINHFPAWCWNISLYESDWPLLLTISSGVMPTKKKKTTHALV